MDRDELFELLDIDSGADFQYFGNFADLVECEEDIESDVVYDMLEDVDLKTFAEICESFFYETLESVPGDQIDLYNLIENIKRALIGLAEAARGEEDNVLLQLADELNIGFVDAGKWEVGMTFDGVHFTEEGHRVFAGKLCEYLYELGFSKL